MKASFHYEIRVEKKRKNKIRDTLVTGGTTKSKAQGS
jgi:hypothetical protein